MGPPKPPRPATPGTCLYYMAGFGLGIEGLGASKPYLFEGPDFAGYIKIGDCLMLLHQQPGEWIEQSRHSKHHVRYSTW